METELTSRFLKGEAEHTCGNVQGTVWMHETGSSQRVLDGSVIVVRLEIRFECISV